MIAARWAIRGIGLVSTIILARLLRPEDFGLVAMGAITVQFVLVFADAGQAMAVIRDVDATSEHFDTAWTMSIAIGITVAAILVAAAPIAGIYFNEPRAVAVVQVIALKPLINGFTNVGVLSFRKDLRFGKEFQFLIVQRLSTFIIGISLALALRSYWALVIANVGGELLSLIASYVMSRYRPRIRLPKLKEIWSYSIWMQFANIGYFLGEQADQILAGRFGGTTAMGAYNVSRDVASAPTNEIVLPMARAVFPIYARLLNEPVRLAETYLGVLAAVAVISFPAGVGVALTAHDLVSLLLGAKWLGITPLVAWLAIGSAIMAIARTATLILMVTGNGSLFALRSWLYVVMLVPAAVVGGLEAQAEGIAVARMLVVTLFLPVVFYTSMRVIPITTGQIIDRLWRPALASLCMAIVIQASDSGAIAALLLRLTINVGLGASTYALSLLCLWWFAGSPPGPEKVVLAYLSRLWQRLRFAKQRLLPSNR